MLLIQVTYYGGVFTFPSGVTEYEFPIKGFTKRQYLVAEGF